MINLPIDFTKNKTQSMIFIALIAALIVIVYFNYLLKPQIVRVAGAVIKVSRIGNDLKNARADIERIGKFKSDIDSYKEKVDRHEKMLPAEQEIPSLLETLSSMAKSSGVKIVGIMPSVTKEVDKLSRSQIYQEIPILISAKSGYHELGRFLNRLENSDRFMKVVDIQIKANTPTPKKQDVELLVLTYILLKK